jgi:hypothetical protein
MLNNISVYWFTSTATSSSRLYWESLRHIDHSEVLALSGVSVFPHELRGGIPTMGRDTLHRPPLVWRA